MNVSDTDAYYLLAGYHFGKWTPYAFYSRSINKSDMPIDVFERAIISVSKNGKPFPDKIDMFSLALSFVY